MKVLATNNYVNSKFHILFQEFSIIFRQIQAREFKNFEVGLINYLHLLKAKEGASDI